MSNSDPFGTYLRELQKNLSTGVATEHTHRSALEALLEATGDCFRDKIRAEVIVMGERQAVNTSAILTEAERRLRSLSPERLRVANDFLAYLQEREENQATAELLSISGFEAAFRRAVEQTDNGDVVRFEDIRRDV